MLSAALKRGRLAHTLLLHGKRGFGSEALAIQLMRILLCKQQSDSACDLCPNCLKSGELAHPDLKVLFPLPALKGGSDDNRDQLLEQFSHLIRRELTAKSHNHYYHMQVENGRGILLDQIRALRRFASMKSYEGGNRVVLIFDAHLMNVNAQNALLKLAEEPPADLYLVLVTSQPNSLLPTIVSRCQSLFVPPQTQQSIEQALLDNSVPPDTASRLARLADGDLGRAIAMVQEEENSIDDTIAFLRLALGNDTAGLTAHLSELTRNRDRAGCRLLLTRLIEWIRDVQLQEISDHPDRWIRHQEAATVLSRFVAAYDTGPIGDLTSLLEDYIDRIDKNLYLNSLLYSLVFDLRSRIKRRPAPAATS
jgi:DNA polymerase III subunit delta'